MLVMHTGRKEEVTHLAFSPTGAMLAAASRSGAGLWRELGDGLRAEHIFNLERPLSNSFSADGRWLLSGGLTAWRVDLATGERSAFPRPGPGSFVRFSVSPTQPLALFNWHLSSTPSNQVVLRRTDDVSDAGRLWERDLPASDFAPQFLPGGDKFARIEGGWVPHAHYVQYRVSTYETATGAPVGTSDVIVCVSLPAFLSPRAEWFVSLSASWLIITPLTLEAGLPATLRSGGRKHFTGVAFHPSGKYLAATSNDETVKLYDTATWEEVRTFTWKIGRMRTIAFSPDGTLAAAGGDKGAVVVWDFDV